MKYMTPELLARIRSNDDDVSEAAVEEWESRGKDYRARLDEIRSHGNLPRGVRRLIKRDRLHDAKVLALAADKGNCFSILLELPGPINPEDKHLELQYRLAGGPGKGHEFIEHPILEGDGKALGWWLYDEVDLTDGPVEAFTHSILFTGGWEVRLTFFSLVWRRLNFLLLPTNNDSEVDPKEVVRLERINRATKASCS